MRSEGEVEKFYEEILIECEWRRGREAKDSPELAFWCGVREALKWVLGGEEFVYRELLEANKDGCDS